jgi:SAM-dependent methyltransferase
MAASSGRWATAVHRARTEGGTPVRQALAIGLGLYIGATPFLGLHLALAVGLGWLFGLNRVKVYAAAQISNPLVAPFLYAIEAQVGSRLRNGHFLTLSRIDDVRLPGLAADILLGSVVVGLTLAAIGAALTYWGPSGRRADPFAAALVAAAADRYLAAGMTAWEFARGKLRMDPLYLQILREGQLPPKGRLLDLGCGQGYLLALLGEARNAWHRGHWPVGWPAPPVDLELCGVDSRPHVVARARRIVGDVATIDELDLTTSTLPTCDAVVLADVLHLLPRDAQDRLLSTMASVMPVGGVVIIREADADGGWKFRMVRAGNRFNSLLQGWLSRQFAFDSISGWNSRLSACGFEVERVERHDTGAFANALLYARLARRPMTPSLSERAESTVTAGVARSVQS